MMVSIFPHIKATTGGHACPISQVLDGIQSGKWQREVEAVRRAETKTERRQLKMSLPYFTASGTFSTRNDAGLLQHSGLVALDLDADQNPGMNLASVKAILAADAYTYALFVSAGGEGLCALVRIPADNHGGSFRSLKAYYKQAHGLIVDSLGDVSRPRYVSFDPSLYTNPDAETWEDVELVEASLPQVKPMPASAYRASSRGEGYGQDALARAVGKVHQAPDGQKHVTLNKMAYLLGGVIAGGFLSEEEARQGLRAAIGSRDIGDEKGAFKTIEDGLAAGLLKPVLPEALQYSTRQQLRNGGTVATVALGIAASQGLPADAVTPAVQAVADELVKPGKVLETFWDVIDPGHDKPLKLSMNITRYGKWLGENGFRQRAIGDKTQLVRLDGCIVHPLVRSGLKAFVLAYLEELPFEFDGIYRSMLEEAVRRQHVSLFEPAGWEFLPFLSEEFVRATEHAGQFFYKNGWAEATATGWGLRPYSELPGLVWASQLRARNFPVLELEEVELAEYFKFLWNISGHKEPRLLAELLLHGYYLHGYKDPSTPKIGVLVDEIAGTEGQSNGGTGKSLIFKAIGQIVEVVEVDGKGYDPRNAKALQQVTDATRVIFFNDWDTHRLPFDRLFNMATDTLTVDRLYTGQQSYAFEVSPKVAITTNGILSGQGGSHDRRKFELEIAPHYGPGFQPRDEFGHNFFSGWDAAEWGRFDNLMLYACHLFLKEGKRLVAPVSENLERRRLLSGTSAGFVDFMDAQPRGVTLMRTQLLSDFRAAEGYDEKFTPEKFGRWLAAYKELSTDFQSGQGGGDSARGARWIILAKDSKLTGKRE